MPQVTISDETFARLQRQARPLVDTIDTVMTRALERFAFRLQCIQNLGSSWSTRRGGQRRVQSRQLRGRRQRCAPLPRAYGV